MKILVLGSGAREHALCWALSRSSMVSDILAVPGNPGIAETAKTRCLSVSLANPEQIVARARSESPDLVVIGPEAPLVSGLADRLRQVGVPVLGPSEQAARLESSKSFARRIAEQSGIKGPEWRDFDDPEAARAWVRKCGAPIVVKADGLAQGKGVVVASSIEEAENAIANIMERKIFGAAAGRRLVIEEALTGIEISRFFLVAGGVCVPFGAARDYKRLKNGDSGPNTGGMGAVSTAQTETQNAELAEKICATMAAHGASFEGVLFAGLMVAADGTEKLLEFNIRFGDPECQSMMMRFDFGAHDFAVLLRDMAHGEITRPDLPFLREDLASVVINCVAKGYPFPDYETDCLLPDLSCLELPKNCQIFHAGTKKAKSGEWYSAGGRVLSLAGVGSSVSSAREQALQAAQRLNWGYWRTDIAKSFA